MLLYASFAALGAGWIRDILGLTWQQCADERISWRQLRERLGVKDILAYVMETALGAGSVMRGACPSVAIRVFCSTVLYEAAGPRVSCSSVVARGALWWSTCAMLFGA